MSQYPTEHWQRQDLLRPCPRCHAKPGEWCKTEREEKYDEGPAHDRNGTAERFVAWLIAIAAVLIWIGLYATSEPEPAHCSDNYGRVCPTDGGGHR